MKLFRGRDIPMASADSRREARPSNGPAPCSASSSSPGRRARSPRWSTSSGWPSPRRRGCCRRWSAAGWCTATGPARSGRARCSRCTPPGRARCTTSPSWPARRWSTCREVSQETVNLAVPRGGQVVQIDQVDSRYLVGATNWVGVDVPAALHGAGQGAAAPTAHSRCRRATWSAAPRTPRSTAPSSTTPSSRCAAAAGRPRSTSWSSGSPPSAPRCGRSTAPSSPPSRSPGRPAASTTTASPRLGDLLVAELRGLSALLGHQPAGRKAASA